MAAKLTAAQKEILARIDDSPRLFHQIVTTSGEALVLGRLLGLGLVDNIDHPTVTYRMGSTDVPAMAYIITADGKKAIGK